MPTNYVQVTRKDLGKGIDSFSAKGSIPPGFAERLENVDTNANGQLTTRKGYEGYYGWLPLRVTEVEHLGTKIRFKLDSANVIDFSVTKKGPIVVYGKLSSAQSGDFTDSDSVHYYPTFDVIAKDGLTPPSGTLTKTNDQVGADTSDIWVGLTRSDSDETRDNTRLWPDEVRIDTSSYQVDIDYEVNQVQEAYFFYQDVTPTATIVYREDVAPATGTFTANDATDVITATGHGLEDGEAVEFTTTGTLPAGLSTDVSYYVRDVAVNSFKVAATEGGVAVDITDTGSGTHTFTQRSYKILAGTHQLRNFNILVQAQDTTLTGGKQTVVTPEAVSVDTSGTVLVEFTEDFTGRLYLQSAPLTNAVADAAVTGPTPTLNQFTISEPGSAFNFVQGYRYNATLARYEQVIIDDLVYDSAADELTIDYWLAATSGEPVEFYWVNGEIVANIIEVEDSTGTSTNYVDTAPQVTLWGVDHGGIYKRSAKRGGHVNHIDGYRTTGDVRVLSGLGGCVFRSLAYEEGSSQYGMGFGYANLRARADGDQYLAPLFHTTDPGANTRSRGVIFDSTVRENSAQCTAVTFVSAGVQDFTLTFSGKNDTLTLGSQATELDILSTKLLTKSANNGNFPILAITDNGPTEVVVRVSNPNAVGAHQDEAGVLGRAGVFTDKFDTEASTNFVPDDVPISGPFSDGSRKIIAVDGIEHYVDGVTSTFEVPDGLAVYVQRTGDVLPLRDAQGTPTVENFVQGDILRVSGLSRRVRVLCVNSNPNLTATLIGDGTTVTADVGTAHGFNVGQRVALTGDVDAIVTILSLPDSETFTFAGTVTSGTTTVLGYTLHLDEGLTVQDGTNAVTFTVDGRWVPVEAPTDNYDLTPATYPKYLDQGDYDEQAILRSTTIADSMYFTNHEDEVYKFDGANFYRAGLPRWQLGLFAQRAASASAVLNPKLDLAYTAKSDAGKYFEVDTPSVQPGDWIYEATADERWLVTSVDFKSGSDKYHVIVRPEDDISGTPATGTLVRTVLYKYYHRLNAVDANDNIIVSAPVNSEDQAMIVTGSGQLRLRCVGMPAWGAYDYDRLELETYRTTADGALYYLVNRQVVSFNQAEGYLDINDALQDSTIEQTANLDVTNILVGGELGTGWDEPPRAAGVTSADNRLLLYDIKSYPELNLVLKPAVGNAYLTTGNLQDKRFLFRRDSSDTGTTTDNTNRVAFEYKGFGAHTLITPATDISTTDSTFTVTETAHGLVAGNWVYMFHTIEGTDNELKFAGWWQIASADANTFTINYENGSYTPTANDVDAYLTATDPNDVPIWISTDGNLMQRDGNPGANSESAAAYRLASAINATQRMCATDGFTPWLAAGGGNDFQSGQIVIRSPIASSTLPEVVLPSDLTGMQVFAEDLKRAASAQVGFRVRRFPSRLLRSYENYPELFDSPFASSADYSDSVIDVNPADGQRIVTAVPFFGTATTGKDQALAQEVLVFKPNSIYAVNVQTRFVQKLDSRGLGCTAPRSVAYTRNGVIFANESGIYRVSREMQIEHIGLPVDELWKNEVNSEQLSEAVGHHYAAGRRYKLSVPSTDATYPNIVFVYDYDREPAQPGAWTLYTNHEATGWCNLERDAFFASQSGDVFLVRNRAEASDYRDEADPVGEAIITLRAEDFDLPGIRKIISRATALLELPETDLTDLEVQIAMDLSNGYQDAGDVTLSKDEQRQATVRATPPSRRGTHVQLRFKHQAKDEQLRLTGVVYKVGQITDALVTEVEDT